MASDQEFEEGVAYLIELATKEARRLKHKDVNTEHLLLALTSDEAMPASQLLKDLGVDYSKIRPAVEFIVGQGKKDIEPSGLNRHARRAYALARDEYEITQDLPLDMSVYLLMGLLREGEGPASGLMESLGVTYDKTRARSARYPPVPIGDYKFPTYLRDMQVVYNGLDQVKKTEMIARTLDVLGEFRSRVPQQE